MTATTTARIGPNAIIQMGEALSARKEEARAAQIYGRAGLLPYLAHPPHAMVDEGEVARLFKAVSDEAKLLKATSADKGDATQLKRMQQVIGGLPVPAKANTNIRAEGASPAAARPSGRSELESSSRMHLFSARSSARPASP